MIFKQNVMEIKQFEYKALAHYSYAIESQGEIVIIDPERDPSQYYAYAQEKGSRIRAVIETHPHADFISSHLQIHNEAGAEIYTSTYAKALYPHNKLEDGDTLKVGSVVLKAIHTPGHSPDSISIVAMDGDDTALFTGDTLFVGDVGRPDLREDAENKGSKRQELAAQMYHTIQNAFNDLPVHTRVYPAHGEGSLCGKDLGSDSSSTLGKERKENWAFQNHSKDEFIERLLNDLPFIPHYFGWNVDLNNAGADNVRLAKGKIPYRFGSSADGLLIDSRKNSEFRKGHLKGSINIQAASEDAPFETWLGAIVRPTEIFYLVVPNPHAIDTILARVTKIGYEKNLKALITPSREEVQDSRDLDLNHFRENTDAYSIVDVRNENEVQEGKYFPNAIAIPLHSLRERTDEVPTGKPIVVHCSGGFRSAAGSSILMKAYPEVKIYDLGEKVEQFKEETLSA